MRLIYTVSLFIYTLLCNIWNGFPTYAVAHDAIPQNRLLAVNIVRPTSDITHMSRKQYSATINRIHRHNRDRNDAMVSLLFVEIVDTALCIYG